MKNHLYAIAAICIVSVAIYFYFVYDSALKSKGDIVLKNGNGDNVAVPYTIFDDVNGANEFPSTEFSSNFSKEAFTLIAEKSSLGAKYLCKYKPTYDPKEISLTIRHDTISVLLNFNAKTGFGVTNESTYFAEFKGEKFIREFAR